MVLVGVIILLLVVILALCYNKYRKIRSQVDFAEEQVTPSPGFKRANVITSASTVVLDNSGVVNVVSNISEPHIVVTDQDANYDVPEVRLDNIYTPADSAAKDIELKRTDQEVEEQV